MESLIQAPTSIARVIPPINPLSPPIVRRPSRSLNLAAELTDAQTQGDAESLAAIAWQLYGEVGEDLAEIGRLRAAIHAAWNRPQETASPVAA